MDKRLRSAVVGTIAGAAGTLAMDLIWYRRYRSGGGTQPFMAWETSDGTTGYENAAAPARTAKAVADMAGVRLPDNSARAANNAVHWLTGLTWGQAHSVVSGVSGSSHPLLGLATAVVAWTTSYLVLPRLGVYRQISEYEPQVLWQDLSAHLVYGVTLGVVYRLSA